MPRIDSGNIMPFCDAEIYIWHIEESCDELSSLIADNGLSLAEVRKMSNSSDRQREWLAVRALLKCTPYKDEAILYHSYGKPYLAGGSKHISISHTREYVAIAFSDNPIGLDIENACRNAIGAVRAFLQPNEVEMLSTSDDLTREALFLWSAKEAAFKLASPKVTVLKEIGITKNANFYAVNYPDNSVAHCKSIVLGDIILSVAGFIDI